MVEEKTTRYTIRPSITWPLVMKTISGAACNLHEEGKPDPSIDLFADQDGLIHFHVRIPEETDSLKASCRLRAGRYYNAIPLRAACGIQTDA
ncbi:MAG: hypothetical protein WBF33_02830 [Candidatus Nitrosopolaris sp.]|jgi:hypothetical protein